MKRQDVHAFLIVSGYFSCITCKSIRHDTSVKYVVLDFQKSSACTLDTWGKKKKAEFSKSASRAALSRGKMDVGSFKNQVLYWAGFWGFFLIFGVNFQLCCVHKINCM